MADVEFIIPITRDDLTRAKSDQYYVTDICSIRDVTSKLSDCKRDLNAEVPDFILKHFDSLYSLLTHVPKLEFPVVYKIWGLFYKANECFYEKVGELLHSKLDVSVCYTMRTSLKMHTYLLVELVRGIEDKINEHNKKNLLLSVKGTKKKTKDSEDWDWESHRHEGLVLLYKLLNLQLTNLWNPPIIEEEFVNLVANCCYKCLENEEIGLARHKHTRGTIFQLLGALIKKYNHGYSFVLKIMQLMKLYEHLATPVANGMLTLVRECGCGTLVRHLLRELGSIDEDALAGDTAMVRALGHFLPALSECVPDEVLPHVDDVLLPLLSQEPAALRSCVLASLGELVVSSLSEEGQKTEQKALRDMMLDCLEEHMHDVSPSVRSKVLQVWLRLCQTRAIPLSRQAPVLRLCIGRLQDKMPSVRRVAWQLATGFLEGNPFTAQLSVEQLEAQVLSHSEKLKGFLAEKEAERQEAWNKMEAVVLSTVEEALSDTTPESDEVSNQVEQHAGTKLNDADLLAVTIQEMQDYLDVGDFSKALDVLKLGQMLFPQAKEFQCDKEGEPIAAGFVAILRKIYMRERSKDKEEKGPIADHCSLVNYAQNMAEFVRTLEQVFPVTNITLHSPNPTEVLEAINFTRTAARFSMASSEQSMQHMLWLAWSKEAGLRDSVASAYQEHYLDLPPPAEGDSYTRSERDRALHAIKNLCYLFSTLRSRQREALQRLMRQWVRKGVLGAEERRVLWEKVQSSPSPEDVRLAVQVLTAMADAEPKVLDGHVDTLLSVGFGPRGERCLGLARETCLALMRLVPERHSTSSEKPPVRFPMTHNMFARALEILDSSFHGTDGDYLPFVEAVIRMIYRISDNPEKLCSTLLHNMLIRIQRHQEEDRSVNSEYLVRLFAAAGEVAFQQMHYLETSVLGELKRRNFHKQPTPKVRKGKSRSPMSSNSSYQSQDMSDEEQELSGNTADDLATEQIRNICENEITSDEMIAPISQLVVEVCSQPSQFPDSKLQRVAALCLGKLMLVSSVTLDCHMELLVTLLEQSPQEQVRSNLAVMLADMALRFPNNVEPWTPHLYKRLHDDSPHVRKSTIMVLSFLIMNEMVKVKGQISDLAMCIVDSDKEIAGMACSFFTKLSQNGNVLYNVMTDIISNLSSPELNLEEEKFNTIMRFILPLVTKERQLEAVADKLYARLAAATNERQWSDLAMCLSLLPYTERMLRRLLENLSCVSGKLHCPPVAAALHSIQATAARSSKAEVKALAEDIEQWLTGDCQKGVSTNKLLKTPSGQRLQGRRGSGTRGKSRTTPRQQRQPRTSDSDQESDSRGCKTAVKRKRPKAIIMPAIDSGDEDFDDEVLRPRVSRPRRATRAPVIESDDDV